jgi:hypothetical protein
MTGYRSIVGALNGCMDEQMARVLLKEEYVGVMSLGRRHCTRTYVRDVR